MNTRNDTGDPGAFGLRSLDAVEQLHRSVLSGMRICQLYAYLLLFELLLTPVGIANQILGWLFGLVVHWWTEQPLPPLALAMHDYGRSIEELFYIANVTLIFFIYASLRRAYWILGLCFIGLSHNVYVTYVAAFVRGPQLAPGADGQDLRLELALMSQVFFVGIAAVHLWFFWVAYRGQRSVHTGSPQDARLVCEPGFASRPWRTTLMSMFNIPSAIRYSRRPLWTGALQVFGGLSNFVNYWVVTAAFFALSAMPVLIAIFAAPVAGTYQYILSRGVDGNAALATGILGLGTLFVVGVFVSIPVFVQLLGKGAIALARRTMRRSLHEIQAEDLRAPILFLRSFLDDQVLLAPRRFMPEQWLLDGASRSMTLDYMLLSEGTTIGPTVALGNPDDPAPPYGVARGYFEHSDWQHAVAGLCERSAAIVMVLDGTEGVAWEIEHIVQSQYLYKTLFLLSPGDVCSERGEHLLCAVLDSLGHDASKLTRHDTQRPLGLQVDRAGQVELLTTREPTVYTYLMALRHFLRGKLALQG